MRVADDLLAGKKKEGNSKKVKTPQSANVPDLNEGTDPMWGAAAAGEEFNDAERDTSSSSEEVYVV